MQSETTPTPRHSPFAQAVAELAGRGLGHEDIYVELRRRGIECHKVMLRRYVLGLSQYTNRFGT